MSAFLNVKVIRKLKETPRVLDPGLARQFLMAVGERIVHKLPRRSYLPLKIVPARRKGCAVTRSFSSRITERTVLEQVMAAHATQPSEKLRRDGLAVSAVTIFYHTIEHDQGDPMRVVSKVVHLPEATNNSWHLTQLGDGPVPWRPRPPLRVASRPMKRSSASGVSQHDRQAISDDGKHLFSVPWSQRCGTTA